MVQLDGGKGRRLWSYRVRVSAIVLCFGLLELSVLEPLVGLSAAGRSPSWALVFPPKLPNININWWGGQGYQPILEAAAFMILCWPR